MTGFQYLGKLSLKYLKHWVTCSYCERINIPSPSQHSPIYLQLTINTDTNKPGNPVRSLLRSCIGWTPVVLGLTLQMWIRIPQRCSLNQIRRHHKRYLSLINHDKTDERWGAEVGCSERASESDTCSGREPRRIGSTGSESAECGQSVGARWIEPSDMWSPANPNSTGRCDSLIRTARPKMGIF